MNSNRNRNPTAVSWACISEAFRAKCFGTDGPNGIDWLPNLSDRRVTAASVLPAYQMNGKIGLARLDGHSESARFGGPSGIAEAPAQLLRLKTDSESRSGADSEKSYWIGKQQ